MKALPPLVIRADASAAMGTGHVMRMLALAQAWKDYGGAPCFVSASMPDTLRGRLLGEGVDVYPVRAVPGSTDDATATAKHALKLGAEWIVLDGYQFGGEFQREVKEGSSLHILVVDDYGHADHYWADLVVNQNLYASKELYPSAEGSTRFLLGAQYLLLRREFWPWREQSLRNRAEVRRILVTTGGADPRDVTGTLLPALIRTCGSETEIRVIVGSASSYKPDHSNLEEAGCRVFFDHDVQDMAKAMYHADIAVASAGVTAWELAFMGVPSILVAAAENQRRVARALDAAQVARDLGSVGSLKPSRINHELRSLISNVPLVQEMSRRGRDLVDGYGVVRVCAVISGAGLWLRPARGEDRERLWYWANEPSTRANSFSADPISWQTHVRWFTKHIASGRSLCYIGFTPDGYPVGQARFDDAGTGATISVSVDPKVRGQGYGAKLIKEALRLAMRERGYEQVTAYIKKNNTASVRAFQSAGFHSPRPCTVEGIDAIALHVGKDEGADPEAS